MSPSSKALLVQIDTDPSPFNVSTAPMTMATAVTAGMEHSCAVIGPAGTPRCWGHNGAGQLGFDCEPPRQARYGLDVRRRRAGPGRHRGGRGRLPHLRPQRRQDPVLGLQLPRPARRLRRPGPDADDGDRRPRRQRRSRSPTTLPACWSATSPWLRPRCSAGGAMPTAGSASTTPRHRRRRCGGRSLSGSPPRPPTSGPATARSARCPRPRTGAAGGSTAAARSATARPSDRNAPAVSTHLTGATAYDLGGTFTGGQERGTVCKVVVRRGPLLRLQRPGAARRRHHDLEPDPGHGEVRQRPGRGRRQPGPADRGHRRRRRR